MCYKRSQHFSSQSICICNIVACMIVTVILGKIQLAGPKTYSEVRTGVEFSVLSL